MLNSIIWPQGFLPGFTDNFVSNEVIIQGKLVTDIWPYLINAKLWPSYYSNSSSIELYGATQLQDNLKFSFKTFGFPVDAKIVEFIEPIAHHPARIAWHGWAGEINSIERLDVHHAWLIENLSDNRVRILTQETQIGIPAKALALEKPNPMLNGHQDWLDGLAKVVNN
ncbi:SRPBCC domain-containing protein (plasmid) [Acinetobacter sp. ESL0695]|uniref:SRPBCC domain-containing protein n=1 Tax=Acinetobacter sp. ESL0695 TaxID=2983215 RepID=UPI0023F10A39|nr:SRPBCC domain-containing protein [Acinetobacter sp. ESL0695]WEV50167.1 SRPBCC domain-containing protein [Acinetobacter sp. ESL0695]